MSLDLNKDIAPTETNVVFKDCISTNCSPALEVGKAHPVSYAESIALAPLQTLIELLASKGILDSDDLRKLADARQTVLAKERRSRLFTEEQFLEVMNQSS